MKYKCHDCAYKLDWQEGKLKYPICIRRIDMTTEQGKLECEKPGVCPHKVTHRDIDDIVYGGR